MSFQLKFWGVRGSIPSAPLPQDWVYHIEGVLRNFFASGFRDPAHFSRFLQNVELTSIGGYGTATTCVEVKCGKTQLILDGGSGIRNLSDSIMSGATGRVRGPFHILMTHFHWDHIIGLPFFTPHFIPGVEIHYYAVQEDLESLIRGVFRKPYFPVAFEDLLSHVHFHVLEPRKAFKIDDVVITPYLLDHPDPCWGYKIEYAGKCYAHCVDTEGTRVTPDELGLDLPLYQNVDLMYFDAQYTLPELAYKANWGHSAPQVGIEIALREKIGHVLFSHHDPTARTENIIELRRQTNDYFQSLMREAKENNESISQLVWDFAYEGQEIKLV
jgi:phosphoribosyl 1,2-cyclic phosphodiesterase